MTNHDCVIFLQAVLPHLGLHWLVHHQACKLLDRRLQALNLPDLAAYRTFLERHPAEWAELSALCRVIEKESVVITSLQCSEAPTLPKGLPQPPDEPSVFVVYIAMKQWRKVKETLAQNPEDKLIIEGYSYFDRRIGQAEALTFYAQSVTTAGLQRARRVDADIH